MTTKATRVHAALILKLRSLSDSVSPLYGGTAYTAALNALVDVILLHEQTPFAFGGWWECRRCDFHFDDWCSTVKAIEDRFAYYSV